MNKPAQYPKSVLKLIMQIIKEMKAEEKTLLTLKMSYCHAFSKNLKSLTKDDWVVSTIFELDSMSNNLKNNMD